MSGRYLVYLSLLTLTSLCVGQLSCSQTVCSGETYNATCEGSPIDSLSWQILDRNGIVAETFSSDDYISSNSSYLGSVTVGGVDIWFFRVNNMSMMLNFTAAPAIDGYWLVCSAQLMNSNTTRDFNCSIQVNTVRMPQNLTLDFTTITDSSIIANWTSWPDDCLQSYQVNVSAGGMIWTNTTSKDQQYFTIWARPNLTASTQYRLTVTPVGLNGPNANQAAVSRPIIFDVPLPVTNLRASPMFIPLSTPDMSPINVTIRWTATQQPFGRPRTNAYYITHNATRHLQMMSSGSGSGLDSDYNDTATTFFTRRIPVPRGQMRNFARLTMGARVGDTYTVWIIPSNVLGNGTAANLTFSLIPRATPTTPTPSMTTPPPTSTPDVSMSPSVSPTDSSGGLATWAVAVIAVVAGIVLAAVVAAAIIIICCCFCIFANAAKRQEEHEMTEGTKL